MTETNQYIVELLEKQISYLESVVTVLKGSGAVAKELSEVLLTEGLKISAVKKKRQPKISATMKRTWARRKAVGGEAL